MLSVALSPSMLDTKSSSGTSPIERTTPSKIFWWRISSAKNSTMRTRDTGSGARFTLCVIERICSWQTGTEPISLVSRSRRSTMRR